MPRNDSTGFAEQPNPCYGNGFRTRFGEDDAALPAALRRCDDRMSGADELSPTRPGKVTQQVRSTQWEVVTD
jgi:hypothetical protein